MSEQSVVKYIDRALEAMTEKAAWRYLAIAAIHALIATAKIIATAITSKR